LKVPFFGSSLLQIPMVLASMGRDQKVGVLTADGSKLKVAPALENCGVTDLDRVNLSNLERDLVNVARRMVAENPDVGAIVLECTEFPPHAHAIQDAVHKPVWGFTTMAYWIHDGLIRKQFTGWV
jgi:Asp/Glu/hydantoin racemase